MIGPESPAYIDWDLFDQFGLKNVEAFTCCGLWLLKKVIREHDFETIAKFRNNDELIIIMKKYGLTDFFLFKWNDSEKLGVRTKLSEFSPAFPYLRFDKNTSSS